MTVRISGFAPVFRSDARVLILGSMPSVESLWDSVQSCVREGSLDSAIRTPVPNDFEYLYTECPGIESVLFNGAAAQQMYMRLVKIDRPGMRLVRLPSTSPAYTLKYEQKLRAWAQAIKEATNYAESL